MALLSLAQFHCVFHFVCLLVTIGLGISCLVKYFSDQDISRVDYKKFHHEVQDNIYPSISLCIINPFLEHELKKYGDDDINITSYSYFLQGLHWDDRMLKIDFDNVTVSLTDNLDFIYIQLHNDTYYIYDNIGGNHQPPGWTPNFYVSFRSSVRKCFTFDIPYLKQQLVSLFGMVIRNSIFPKGVRPVYFGFDGSNPDDGGGFLVYFHYPGQRFTSYYTIKYEWDSKINNSNPYYMKFDVKDVEVIKHRNKPQQPCIDDWRNYDQVIMDDIMLKAGCRPPHWDTTQNLSWCSKPEQMKHFKDQPTTTKVQSFDHPCNVIESLHYTYYEKEFPKQLKGLTNETSFTFWVLHRQTTFREIKQIRAYDVDSLYGNIGGYMGLFLGYALLNLPTLFIILFGSIKKSMLENKASKTKLKQNKVTDGMPNLMMMLGTTTIMMHTIDDRNLQTKTHEQTERNVEKYDEIINKLDERLRAVEEQLK